MSMGQKIWGVLRGFLVAIAVVVLLPIAGLLLGTALAWINTLLNLIDMGETSAWLGLLFALYALYAGIIVGPAVWWRASARNLGAPSRVLNLGTVAVIVTFSLICGWVLLGEQSIEANLKLDAVSSDGTTVLATYFAKGSSTLYKINSSTGEASPLLPSLGGYQGEASISPDGRQVAFAYSKDERNYTIMLTDTSGWNARLLLPDAEAGSFPRFSNDGQTVYFARQEGTVDEEQIDIFSASVSGADLKQLTDDHFTFKVGQFLRGFSLSSDSRLLLMTTGESLLLYQLPSQKKEPLQFRPAIPSAPSTPEYDSAYLSPDGTNITGMSASNGKDGYDYEIYRADLRSKQVEKLSSVGSYASDFCLSPDRTKAAFLKWQFTRFQRLPRSYELEVMDLQNGSVRPVKILDIPK